jgi:hypothetical protein
MGSPVAWAASVASAVNLARQQARMTRSFALGLLAWLLVACGASARPLQARGEISTYVVNGEARDPRRRRRVRTDVPRGRPFSRLPCQPPQPAVLRLGARSPPRRRGCH